VEALVLVVPAGAQQRRKMVMTWSLADCRCSSSLRYQTRSTSNLDYLRDALSPKSKCALAASSYREIVLSRQLKHECSVSIYYLKVNQREAAVFRALNAHKIEFSMVKPVRLLKVL
jgi:hypothetical protein